MPGLCDAEMVLRALYKPGYHSAIWAISQAQSFILEYIVGPPRPSCLGNADCGTRAEGMALSKNVTPEHPWS